MKRRRSPSCPHLAALAVVALALAVGCGGPVPATPSTAPTAGPSGATSSASPAGATATPATTAAPTAGQFAFTIPEPPHAAPAPAGSVDEQATALAAAVTPGGQGALAPLLTAYHLAGLPVIGTQGESLVGDPEDPVGLPYWLVWLSAGSNPNVRLSLPDALKVFVAMPNAPDLDTAALAEAALADLREMASASNPQQRFYGRFVAALAASAGSDPLDPAAAADEVMLNSMATTYLVAAALRGVVTEVAQTNPQGVRRGEGLLASTRAIARDWPIAQAQAATSPCNFSGVPEQIAYWGQAIASRLAGGLQLPGMLKPLRSLVQVVVSNPVVAQRITAAAGWAGGVVSALGLLIQMTHIDADVVLDPEPLVRTKSSGQDGDEATLTAAIVFDLQGSNLDGGQGVGNCLALLLNAFGIQAALPSSGRLPGASVEFEGAQGFNQGLGSGGFVQFPNASQLQQDTNQNGEVSIDVQGIHQRKDKSQYATEWLRDASLKIHSTAGQVNERTIASVFVNGLLAIPSGGQTALGALVDVLSTVKWDVGEQVFRVKDWIDAWYIDQPFVNGLGGGHIIGQKCDGLDGTWTAQGVYDQAGAQGNQVWNIDIAMQTSSTGRGLFNYSDVQEMPAVGGVTVITTGNARGESELTVNSTNGEVKMNMRETYHVFRATTTAGGSGHDVNAPLQSYDMTWKPGDPNNECNPAP